MFGQSKPDAKSDSYSVNSVTNSKVEETAIEEYGFEEDKSVIDESHDGGRGKGSFGTAYFNIVCVVAGTGTLGLPKAFADGGWLGILILFLAWFMAVYSGIVLIKCLYHKKGERLHDYKQIGKAAFGKKSCMHIAVLDLMRFRSD